MSARCARCRGRESFAHPKQARPWIAQWKVSVGPAGCVPACRRPAVLAAHMSSCLYIIHSSALLKSQVRPGMRIALLLGCGVVTLAAHGTGCAWYWLRMTLAGQDQPRAGHGFGSTMHGNPDTL